MNTQIESMWIISVHPPSSDVCEHGGVDDIMCERCEIRVPLHLTYVLHDNIWFEQGQSRGLEGINGRRCVEVLPALQIALDRLKSTYESPDRLAARPIVEELLYVCERAPLYTLSITSDPHS